ncbi:MAG: hypothetical protein ABI846_09360 [Rudaea sp.]
MNAVSRFVFALLALTQGSALAQDRSAEGFLRAIYGKAYVGKDAKGIDISTRAQLERYFVPELARRIDADGSAAARRGDIGELDGDAFVGAQDWSITAFDVVVTQAGAVATGTVTFSNSGRPAKVIVMLQRLKSGWRIADIDWGEGGKLSALFAKQK